MPKFILDLGCSDGEVPISLDEAKFVMAGCLEGLRRIESFLPQLEVLEVSRQGITAILLKLVVIDPRSHPSIEPAKTEMGTAVVLNDRVSDQANVEQIADEVVRLFQQIIHCRQDFALSLAGALENCARKVAKK